MTWFGKTLAVLNIVGAIAFVVLGFMDFAKREAWAYANYVHDVVVNGLPLDEKVTDDRESPILYDLAPETKNEWFSGNGGSVATQVEEVNRVKGLVDAKLNALGDDPAKQTVEYAHLVMPFARHNAEREWLIGVRTYLATPADAAKLNKRLHDAYRAAVQAYQTRSDNLTFPQAFTNAAHALGGVPAAAFEQAFVNLLPAKPEKTFEMALQDARKVVEARKKEIADKKKADAAKAAVKKPGDCQDDQDEAAGQLAQLLEVTFLQSLRDDKAATLRKPDDDPAKVKDTLDDVCDQARTDVQGQLKGQLDGYFDEALNGPQSAADSTKHIRDAQRLAIAHLLFNLVEGLTDGAGEKGVFGTPDYVRFVSVVGLTAAIREINDEAGRLQQMGEELQSARRLERGEFADAHRALITELQSRAVQLQYALDLLTAKQNQLADEKKVVASHQTDVTTAQEELKTARDKTSGQMDDLRKKSDALHERRIQGRDLLGENLELERQIRSLEQKR